MCTEFDQFRRRSSAPVLIRPHGWRIRALGALLWIGCMTATCYGHAVLFLPAQKHAGEVRATAVPAATTNSRNAAVIAADRATVASRLALETERRCAEPCPSLRIGRATLAARLDAVEAEAAETKRQEAEQDRTDAVRAAAVADQMTGTLRRSVSSAVASSCSPV
jgi:hypothetical protein